MIDQAVLEVVSINTMVQRHNFTRQVCTYIYLSILYLADVRKSLGGELSRSSMSRKEELR
jgi:hypothetical protein